MAARAAHGDVGGLLCGAQAAVAVVGLAVLSVWGGLTVLTCAIVLMRLLAL